MSSSPFSEEDCPTSGKDNSALLTEGYTDTTGNLVAAHDAATAHLGSPWRMPTDEEVFVLIENCTIELITTNGVSGYLVTGKDDYANRSIFLPAAGYVNGTTLTYPNESGYYWSSTPSSNSMGSLDLYIGLDGFGQGQYIRYNGIPVRPVRDSAP